MHEQMVLLIAAAVATGFSAARLPAGGLWTGCSSVFLASLLLTPPISGPGQLFVGIVGLGVSSLLSPHPRGVMLEGVALLSAWLTAHGLSTQWWQVGICYLLVSWLLLVLVAGSLRGHERTSWVLSRRETWLGSLANLAAAILLARAWAPLTLLAVVVLLIGVGRGIRNYAHPLQAARAKKTERKLEVTERKLEVVEKGLDQAERGQEALRQQVQTLVWLSDCLQALAGSLQVDEVLTLLQAQSQVVCRQQSTLINWDGKNLAFGEAPYELAEQMLRSAATNQPVCAPGLLSVPLSLNSGQRGVIGLYKKQESWSELQIQSMLLLCRGASVSLSNSQLFGQLEASRRQLLEAQAQLVQSAKLTAVGQLAAGVAHELNSPLGAIQASLEVALSGLERPDPATLKRRLDRAHQATLRSRTIIDKLLNHSRPSPPDQPFDLAEVVRQSVDQVEAQLAERGVRLELGQLTSISVLGRAGEVQQVLTNLILNGRDASLEAGVGRPAVMVSCERQGAEAFVFVMDNGSGISAEIAGRIFDPFFTTKGPGRGTGLGLWTSLEIARAHRGGLDFETRPGQGSRFRLSLPAL